LFIGFIEIISASNNIDSLSYTLIDSSRNRVIPTTIFYRPDTTNNLIVIFNHGYGLTHSDYKFLINRLAELGYYVVCIKFDLSTDEPLARTGDIYKLRTPVWKRGVDNIDFVISQLMKNSVQRDFNRLILIGHSNGGDISMLFCDLNPNKIFKLISLDNLRYPIPRQTNTPILYFKALDTNTDSGVLPNNNGLTSNKLIIKQINGNHSELSDYGNVDLKYNINFEIEKFLNEK
jgi:hypothetical protein